MISVKLTVKRKAGIKTNATNLFKSRLNSLELPETFWNDIVKHAQREMLKHCGNLPETWFEEMNWASFVCDTDDPYLIETQKYKYKKPLTSGQFAFRQLDVPVRILCLNIFNSGSDIFRIGPEYWSFEQKVTYLDYRKRIHDIIIERDEFLNELSAMLSKCNTSKQLLKLWPEANALFSESLKEVMRGEARVLKKPTGPTPLSEDVLKTLNVSLMKNIILSNR